MSFGTWYVGVMNGIGAPINEVTLDVCWTWARRESEPYDPMHINNPLDSTWGMPGASPWNSFGDGEHVWIYADVQDGITATVLTLLDGRYPIILDHLRRSVPRTQWQDACAELGTWGTGCDWLTTTVFGAAPGGTLPPEVTQTEFDALVAANPMLANLHGQLIALDGEVKALQAEVAKLQPGSPTTPATEPKTVSGTFTGTLA